MHHDHALIQGFLGLPVSGGEKMALLMTATSSFQSPRAASMPDGIDISCFNTMRPFNLESSPSNNSHFTGSRKSTLSSLSLFDADLAADFTHSSRAWRSAHFAMAERKSTSTTTGTWSCLSVGESSKSEIVVLFRLKRN